MINKVYSFPRGGMMIHDQSVPQRLPSVNAFLPSISIIPLIQHPGGPAIPVVSVGDRVKEGMLIGRGKGPYSTNIHATVPGRVLGMVSWESSDKQVLEGIVIAMEGSFEKLGKREELFPWEGMLSYDIQRCIADYGVVEMEGSGRPVSDIISQYRGISDSISLVVRCVFDDPWFASDYILCKERISAVIEGAAIAARTCRVSQIIYAVSYREKELGKMLMDEGYNWGLPVSCIYVSSRYPQRNRRELELVLGNYSKKEGIELGSLLILSPSTLAAVYDAVKLKKPILERYISVGGTAVKKPQIMKVRIGTRIGDIFEECGGFKGNPARIAIGSPFMGRPVYNLDEPITKTSYALFANLEGFKRFGTQDESSCISCGECRTVCPVGLDPEELYKSIFAEKFSGKSLVSESLASDCHGCGCCELVCPSSLPLSTEIISSVKEDT